ncbi:MAG: DUF3887 domain-containing protein [Chloroflexi bacterium]|nr:DUF3887 domain-containing protein [Chloroflexota bacterium]
MTKAAICMLLAVLFTASGGVIACKSSPSPTTEEVSVRVYADPATETTLQGISENNLAKYTQYGNAAFKAAVTQETLNATAAQINSQLGTYQSKEFLRVEEQQGYTLVHYKAKFSKGEVGIRMVFDKDNLVAGQWFE